MLPLFGLTIFVAAGLVFLVQPMMAKLLLPYFGGTPQVWIAALVFFQAALLAGYAYAHVSFRLLGLRRQPIAHLLLLVLPLASLPIAVRSADLASGPVPALAVLGILVLSVGAPYVAVTAASPVLQRWFSTTGHVSAADPYFLYAASNAGSFMGLLAFPVLLEPALRSADQTALWSIGYVAYVALTAGCAIVIARAGRPADVAIRSSPGHEAAAEPADGRIGWSRQARWVLLAFVPSSLMLGVTTHLSADIAAAPLLWVIPLALYLSTFIVAFSRRMSAAVTLASRLLPVLAVLAGLSLLRVLPIPIWTTMALHYTTFLAAGTAVHGRLAADRPPATELTRFYLLISVGGVLGGVFNALVAPIIFDSVLEYPLVLVMALMVGRSVRTAGSSADQGRDRRRRLLDLLAPLGLYLAVLVALAAASVLAGADAGPILTGILVAAVLVSLLAVRRPIRFALALGAVLAVGLLVGRGSLFSDRTFFGINRVIDDGQGRHVYLSGTTIHGAQHTDPALAGEPLSYYHRDGPLGDVFAVVGRRSAPVGRVAIVGLGAGAMAAYARDGETWTFYEIDPVVDRIARDPALFTYLRDAPIPVETVLGDGRLELARVADRVLDVLVVDAFTGDAVPAHLMTEEAGALYRSKLGPGGLLVLHVSNRHLDVRAVAVGLARVARMEAIVRVDSAVTGSRPGDREVSEWLVAAASAADLDGLAVLPGWSRVTEADRAVTWTDDFSNILAVIDWAR